MTNHTEYDRDKRLQGTVGPVAGSLKPVDPIYYVGSQWDWTGIMPANVGLAPAVSGAIVSDLHNAAIIYQNVDEIVAATRALYNPILISPIKAKLPTGISSTRKILQPQTVTSKRYRPDETNPNIQEGLSVAAQAAIDASIKPCVCA